MRLLPREELLYEMIRDACCLAKGYKSRILVSLRVFMMKCVYIYL